MSTQISAEITAQIPPPPPSSDGTPTNPPVTARAITYNQLLQDYEENHRLSRHGAPRSEQVFKNIRSAANSWVEFNELTVHSPIGDELSLLFLECLNRYLDSLAAKGLKGQTIRDRKSLIRALHISYHQIVLSDGLPADPSDALDFLIRSLNVTNNQVARNTGLTFHAVQRWRYKDFRPRPKSLPGVHRLEAYLGVPKGTLSSRLPGAYWATQGYDPGQTTWRRHQSILKGLQYQSDSLPQALLEEWDELLQFFTAPDWAEERGLTNFVQWSVRPQTGRCGTAEVKLTLLRSFFGYLGLKRDNADVRLRGAGLEPNAFTLALLSDYEIFRGYLNFMKSRNALKVFNNWTINAARFSSQLLRPKTGYLWQRLEFAEKMPKPIPRGEWRAWCETNRAKLLNFCKRLTGRPNDGVSPTRDSFEPVRSLIENLQHPITALLDLIEKLEALTPFVAKCCPATLALHVREIFLIKLLTSNPLRVENLSMMTYVPRHQSAFEEKCESYGKLRALGRSPSAGSFFVETDVSSNLYQKPDGSWWLRYRPEDFKSLKSNPLRIPYDVPVIEWVWPTLIDYLFMHRAALNQRLKQSIDLTREKRNLRPLTEDEEKAIDRCSFVFRPARMTNKELSAAQLRKLMGLDRLPTTNFSVRLLRLTQRHIPGCPGFGAHACRHIVASEYIKNHPDGWTVAAAALHDAVQTVKRHYAWVRPADKIRPWNNYLEELQRKHSAGEF